MTPCLMTNDAENKTHPFKNRLLNVPIMSDARSDVSPNRIYANFIEDEYVMSLRSNKYYFP